ncbi:hypothetical protein [Algoriphagus boritolerans]|uniref:hypothetical protein n=1 Tax=Algoriphagus boritolerans TaxID=308111 RepID=UPI002FCDFBD1
MGWNFFVTAVIYTNENEILNDDTYETEEIGLPFFRRVGRVFVPERAETKKADSGGFEWV